MSEFRVLTALLPERGVLCRLSRQSVVKNLDSKITFALGSDAHELVAKDGENTGNGGTSAKISHRLFWAKSTHE
jgi:hypothetical protein